MSNDRLKMLVIAVVLALLAVRIFCAVRVELLPEEAYYWTYSKHPALSYFDHPPMVAWDIWLGTAWLGDTHLGVRFVTIIFSLASCLLLYLTARIWFGQRAGLWAVLLFSAVPIFLGIGFLAFPDGPLIFFWLATMYAVSRALHTRRTMYWLLAGLTFGGALLSKYTALLLGVSLVLFLMFSAEHRFWLRRPQPWIASAVAMAVFSPVIIWNAQHEWASFLFQSTRTVAQRHDVLRDVSEFWLVHLGILTPLVFGLFAVTTAHGIKCGWLSRDDKWNFAASFSLPLFLVFALASFKTRVHVNWSAPAFLSLMPGAATIFLDAISDGRRQRARRWRFAGLATAGLCAVVVALGVSTLTLGVPKVFAYSHAGGWRQLADTVEEAEAALERATGQAPFILGADKYNLAAEIGFYTHEPEEDVNVFALGQSGLGFRYWTDLRQFEGHPAIAVLLKADDKTLAELADHFDVVDAPRRVSVPTLGARERTVYLVNCYGYRIDADTLAATRTH